MHVAILSRAPDSYSTRRLVGAAEARGCAVDVLDPLRVAIDVRRDAPGLFAGDAPLPPIDVVIPRIGASITYFGLAVVRQLEQMGVATLASSDAIAASRDKLHALQRLCRHGIGLPRTAFVRDRADVRPAIARLGGAPVVVKLLEGTQGVGVLLAEDERTAEGIVETLHSARQNVLLQEFVAEARGRDLRAIVVGGRVVAAMRRTAKDGDFRSNVHRGASTEPVQLEGGFADTAVRAAHLLGLRVAGVDMLEGAQGPQVLEVNSSPGLEGIETTTGVDVAGAMVDEALALCAAPRA